jgi:hypothetical protein
MKPASALALVAVGAFFFVLAPKRPKEDSDANERVDVNEVVDAETQAKGTIEWRGTPVSVVRFNGTYNIGEIQDDGMFYAEKGNASRRTVFSTLAEAINAAKGRNTPDPNLPPTPSLPPAKPNPYDEADPFNGFGTNQPPNFGW